MPIFNNFNCIICEQGENTTIFNKQGYSINIGHIKHPNKKTITVVTFTPKEKNTKVYDLKKACKVLKREFSCNGTVIDDHEIFLQGYIEPNKIGDFLD